MEDVLMLWLFGSVLAVYMVVGGVLWVRAEIDYKRYRDSVKEKRRA